MQIEAPVHATVENVAHLIGLGGSSEPFLTAYLKTSRHEVLNGELRAHVVKSICWMRSRKRWRPRPGVTPFGSSGAGWRVRR